MYRVSDELLNAIKNNTARALISFDLVSGSVFDITNDEIATLSIERASVSGRSLEIGAARAFEMTLCLNTIGDIFKGVRFEGAEARVRVGYITSRGVEYIPLGVFTVDGCEKKDGKIELAALDRMVKFDRDADFSSIVFPISVESLALRACYACGIDTSRLNLSDLPNASYLVEQAPGACTWRRVLMWCLEIMGVCAYIDPEGYIVAKWYEDTGERLTASDRFDHKIHENDIVVRGVQVIDEEETAHLAGETSGFVFTIEGNELLTHDHSAVASNLAAVLVGFRHRPFEAEVLPHPHLFPLDMLTYIDEDGEEIAVCVSGYIFTMNDNTELTGAGESETTSGYAMLDPMTNRERAIVSAALKKQESQIIEKMSGVVDQKNEALLRMNEIVASALGLYVVTYIEEDGSTQTYFCNKPSLDDSSLIYVFNAGGFAWANKWGGSNSKTVWKYGITKDGNAVLNYLTVEKITAEHIDVHSLLVLEEFAFVSREDFSTGIQEAKSYTDTQISATASEINLNVSAIETKAINAQSAADRANTNATEAYNTAFSAGSKAEQAQTTAQTAQTTANAANATANNAKVAADDAARGAGEALSRASEVELTANGAKSIAEKAETTANEVKAELSLKIGRDENDQIVSMLNASANIINITSNRLVIDSDYFKLSADGKIIATNAEISGNISATSFDSYSEERGSRAYTAYGCVRFSQEYSNYTSFAELSGGGGFYSDYQDSNKNTTASGSIVAFRDAFMISATTGTGGLIGTWQSTGAIAVVSDRNKKHDIEVLDESYSTLFDNLSPVRFKYNDGTSDRFHVGFIAQEVEEAITAAGLTTQDAAFLVHNKTDDTYSLRYSEFIALCVGEIQRLKKRMTVLEAHRRLL